MAVTIEEAYNSSYCYELMLEGRDSEYCAYINNQENNQIEQQTIEEEKGYNIDVEA